MEKEVVNRNKGRDIDLEVKVEEDIVEAITRQGKD